MFDYRKHRDKLLLFTIIFLGFAVRLFFLKHGYLYANDPYLHYSNFLSLMEGEKPLFDLSPGRYLPARLVHTLLGTLGFSAYDSFRLTSPLFGVLTVVPVFLITRKAFGQRIAFTASFLFAFLPAFIHRTIAGNYRGDPFALFFYALGFYFFLASAGRLDRRLFAFALLAAIAFALSGVVWTSGYIFAMIVITGFALAHATISFVESRESRAAGLSYALSAGLGILLLKLLVSSGLVQGLPMGFSAFSTLLFPLTLLAIALLEGMSRATISWSPGRRGALVSLIAVAGLPVFIYSFSGIVEDFLNLFGKPTTLSAGVKATVSEIQPLSTELYWIKFSLSGLAFIPGLLVALRGFRNPDRLFVALWTIASLYLIYIAGQRGAFTASAAIAIAAAAGLVKLLLHERLATFREYPALPRILLLLLLLFAAQGGIAYSSELRPLINHNWVDALEWVSENTSEDSVVLSWWDYGYWIISIAERKAVMTPGPYKHRSEEMASMLLQQSPQQVASTLEKYKVDYIVMPTDMLFQLENLETILGEGGHQYIIYPYRRTASLGAEQITAKVYGEDHLYIFRTKEGYQGFYREGSSLNPVRLAYYLGDEPSFTGNGSQSSGTFFYPRGRLYLPYMEAEDFVIYIPRKNEDTLLTSLMLYRGESYGYIEPVYTNPQIKVYRVG